MKKYEAPVVEVEIFEVGNVMETYTTSATAGRFTTPIG